MVLFVVPLSFNVQVYRHYGSVTIIITMIPPVCFLLCRYCFILEGKVAV